MKTNAISCLLLLAFIFLLAIPAKIESISALIEPAQVPLLHSYFDGTDTEGWTLYLGSLRNPGSGGSGGGDNNGYLRTSPPNDDRTSYFVAPAKYHGDWRNYTELGVELWSYGGTYYSSGYSMYGDIYIANDDKTAHLFLPRRPASTWDSFVVSLDDTGSWSFGGGATSLAEILSNVTDFQIRAEYGVWADHTGLDNVELMGLPLETFLPLILKENNTYE